MKKILLTAAMAATMATTANAASVSGSTDFKVTIPEILVLYHWDEAHLTLEDTAMTAANDSDAHEISDDSTHDLTKTVGAAGPYEITGDVSITNGDFDDDKFDDPITVKLVNAWAVRAISTGDVTLDVAEQSGSYTLKNVDDNSITIPLTDVVLKSDDATGGDGTTSLTLEPQWAAQYGNIEFDMDLSNVTKSGDYTSNGAAAPVTDIDDTFLLTLTGATTTP